MKVTEIIKDALIFPSKNTGRFAMYLLLGVLIIGFTFGGILTYEFGLFNDENYLTGGIYLIIAMLIGFILSGYHIKVIKSGIERDDNVPVFGLFEDFMTGFDNIVVSIVYFLIPALIVMLVGYDTNISGNALSLAQEIIAQTYNVYVIGGSLDIAVAAISQIMVNLAVSIAVTMTVAIVLFAVFSLLQSMAEARLANTGSLKEALNIFESAKDIARIGVGKVIIVALLVVLIFAIIEIVLLSILGQYPFLISIICIILTPYLTIFTQRALGLLYSEIA